MPKMMLGNSIMMFFDGFVFTNKKLFRPTRKSSIQSSWILVDSQSTIDVFFNVKIQILHFIAGRTIVARKRDLKGCDTVKYHPGGIANTLSLQEEIQVIYIN